MRLLVFSVTALLVCGAIARGESDMATIRAADGFQLPIGVNGNAEGYYISRGYLPNGHLGEDWNGVKGGDTDLGDPVYATAHGIVVFAKNYHVGWGNVVILRHAYYDGSALKYVDSLYGHLLDFKVEEGEQVKRGQLIGHLGNNFGMYDAHLHFEMRKNLQIGMFRSSFPRDYSNYYSPHVFIAEHRLCPSGNRMVEAPIHTFAPVAPAIMAGPHLETPVVGPPPSGTLQKGLAAASASVHLPASTSAVSPKVITTTATPTPEPAPKKIAKTDAPTVIVSEIPAPATKSSPAKMPVATAAASPEPALKKNSGSSATAATPAPSAKSLKVEATASATTSEPKSKTVAKANADLTTAPESAPKKAAKSSAATASAATPAATPKSSKARITATTPPPAPAEKTLAPVAAAPAAVAEHRTTKAKPAPTPQPEPEVFTKKDSQAILEPATPAPIVTTTTVTPIRRGNTNSYKFDRFEDMRGKGY
jgi:hypothetical protein